jgi:hypothetical protein
VAVVKAEQTVPEPDAQIAEPAKDDLDVDAEQPMEVVKYNGFHFEVRSITEADWRALGIEHETVTWDASNNWIVARSEFDFLEPLQFHNIIECDPKFTVEVLD